ncbi:MAG: LPS-assembly protein LptD, partial [Thiomicrospira sp.]|uniref:LPS-assembly protein LptD n=1 Tax=Thiomicrospira sp. TaxID=935 RepID=UPI0019E498FD
DRGVVLDNEFRYLQPKHSGELQFSLLQDQLANSEGLRHVDRSGTIINEQPLSERWRISYAGRQNWGAGFSSSLNWQEVSDPDFYNDIPLSFAASEARVRSQTTSLNRSARLNYRQGPVQAHIQHYGYLPLRNGERNYLEKSPEVGINVGQNFGAFRTNLYLETTEFKRYSGFNDYFEDGYVTGQTSTGVMGRRSLALPSIQYQLSRPYARLQAQVQANYREYDLINAPDAASTNNTVMQYALRGSLFFERDVSLFNTHYIQTLEPEVQLLYVPYVDQSHLQRFDTGRTSLDFSNLFQLNRFSGFDRIGDTQQISSALTTRLLNNTGKPLADAAIGQIFYLADREVELAGNQLQDDPRSDYFVRLSANLKSFNVASTSQYDYQTTELTQMQNRLKWQAFDRVELLAVHQALNLNADPALDNTENVNRRQQTIGTGLILGLSSQWQLASYINYDIQQQERREFLGGLRYDSCCWASELVIEQRQLADGRYNTSVNLVFELKGLSTVGSRMRDTIQNTLNF